MRIQCAYEGEGDCENGVYGRPCRRDDIPDDGMTEETEQAAYRGLAWLARHQMADGHWSFDHQQGTGDFILDVPDQCGTRCGNTGSLPVYRVAATGMALLPFLGAGIGPTDPTYGDVVAEGINYLVNVGGALENDGALASGEDAWTWYVGVNHNQGYEQGIAGLALIEALGICRQSGFGDVNEADLTSAAYLVAARIVTCQSQSSGGWRYWCAGGNDVTVTAWNVQALLAAEAVGIDFEAMNPTYNSLQGAKNYLRLVAVGPIVPDSTFGDYASDYQYRITEYWYGGRHYVSYMHAALGSPLQAAGLQQLADDLATEGPEGDSYRKFYSHYFLKRSGGPRWDNWDADMKEYLVDTQESAPEDHLFGSWYMGGRITSECGRTWDTVSALLRLEVYYRDGGLDDNRVFPPPVASPGDTNGDGDVNDILEVFANFTGPNPEPPAAAFTRTRAQGDIDPADVDVDLDDILLLFDAFTGPGGG